MCPAFVNLRTPEQVHKDYINSPAYKKSELAKFVIIKDANLYDKKKLVGIQTPTALEYINNKIYYTPEEYEQLYKNPQFRQAKTFSKIHEFLFDLSYLPFIYLPIRGFDDHS